MAKRTIAVKEKNLIDKLNANIAEQKNAENRHAVRDPQTGRFMSATVREKKKDYEKPETYVWDNNGPVQFETAPEDTTYEERGTRLRTCTEQNGDYEYVNHPKHYNNYDVEVIDMMEKIFGPYQTAVFCKLNAYKYRMRVGTKPNTPVTEDLAKEQWYLKKYRELKVKIEDKFVKELEKAEKEMGGNE